MAERAGEKLGWIGGWLGGFIWVVILSVVFLTQGRIGQALAGLLIASLACACVLFFAPWRHPGTAYRRLMAPIYGAFFVAVWWGVWSLGDARHLGLNSWWSPLLLLPMTLPLWTAGGRRWRDGDG